MLAQRRITDAASAKRPVAQLGQAPRVLPARRHRPVLDPHHPVARTAGVDAGPAAARQGHRRRRWPAPPTRRRPTCWPAGSRCALKCPVRRVKSPTKAGAGAAFGRADPARRRHQPGPAADDHRRAEGGQPARAARRPPPARACGTAWPRSCAAWTPTTSTPRCCPRAWRWWPSTPRRRRRQRRPTTRRRRRRRRNAAVRRPRRRRSRRTTRRGQRRSRRDQDRRRGRIGRDDPPTGTDDASPTGVPRDDSRPGARGRHRPVGPSRRRRGRRRADATRPATPAPPDGETGGPRHESAARSSSTAPPTCWPPRPPPGWSPRWWTSSPPGGFPAIALTGGGVGTKVLVDLNASPARDAVDWRRVEIFWGDERFVPADDPDRNEKQARDALLDHVPVDPARVHAMAPSDGEFGDDVDAAAAAYAALIDARDGLDVVMLGMGGEGHVASIFPESPAVYDTRPVVAVRNCPKPPPTRVSLTLPTIRAGDRGLDHHGRPQQGRRGRAGARRRRGGRRARGRGDGPDPHAVVAGPRDRPTAARSTARRPASCDVATGRVTPRGHCGVRSRSRPSRPAQPRHSTVTDGRPSQGGDRR